MYVVGDWIEGNVGNISFGDWIELWQKSTSSDTYDEIHQVVLDGISDNMASIFESGKYGAISKTDTSTNGFYVIMFTSVAYTLQENTTIDGKIITAVELVVKAQYLCSIKVDTNWYWNQQPNHHFITLPTQTILHPQLEVNTVRDSQAIPKSICTRTQAKKPYQDSLYVWLIITMIKY